MIIINDDYIKEKGFKLNSVHLTIFSYISQIIGNDIEDDRKTKENGDMVLYKITKNELLERLETLLPFKTNKALESRIEKLEDDSFIIRDGNYFGLNKYGVDYISKTPEFDINIKKIHNLEKKELKYSPDDFEYKVSDWFMKLNMDQMGFWVNRIGKEKAIQDWANEITNLKEDISEYLHYKNNIEGDFNYEETEFKKESEDIIRKVLDFVRTDQFRSGQVYSIKKLRKKNTQKVPYWKVLYDKAPKGGNKSKYKLLPSEQNMLRNNYKRFLNSYPRSGKEANHKKLKNLFVQYLIREKVDFEKILQGAKDYALQCKIRQTQRNYTYKHETFLANREREREFQTKFNNKEELLKRYRKLGSEKFQQKFGKEKLDKAKRIIKNS